MKIFKKLFELNSVFWFNKWQPKSALREGKTLLPRKTNPRKATAEAIQRWTNKRNGRKKNITDDM